MSEQRCQQTTTGRGSWSSFVAGTSGPHLCTRKATYTDGRFFYCTQHAKEPATAMAKASGKIRAGLRKLP